MAGYCWVCSGTNAWFMPQTGADLITTGHELNCEYF